MEHRKHERSDTEVGETPGDVCYVVSFIVITHGIGQMLQTLKCERAPAPDATLKPRRS